MEQHETTGAKQLLVSFWCSCRRDEIPLVLEGNAGAPGKAVSLHCVNPTGPLLSTECWRLLCFPNFPGEHSQDHTAVDFVELFLHFQFPGFSGTLKEVRADQAISTFPVPCFCKGFCCQVEEGEGRPGCSRFPAAFPAAPGQLVSATYLARTVTAPSSANPALDTGRTGLLWKDHPPLEAWQSRASPV